MKPNTEIQENVEDLRSESFDGEEEADNHCGLPGTKKLLGVEATIPAALGFLMLGYIVIFKNGDTFLH